MNKTVFSISATLLGSVLLLASSCDDSSSEKSGVQAYEDPLFQVKVIYSESYCDCYSEGNYDSRGQCMERHPGMETIFCENRVMREEAGAVERLECLFSVAEAEAQCLKDNGCGDEDMVTET